MSEDGARRATTDAPGPITVRRIEADRIAARLDAFTRLLIDTVADGGAIGFVLPLLYEDAARFWRDEIAPEVAAGRRALFEAMLGDQLVGTVQLVLSLPPNQPHRCEAAKMMVHPSARRRGVGRALLGAAETHAQRCGKTLITLDTRTGDAAQSLYAGFGFAIAGVIPDFALDPDQAGRHATTYMYKALAPNVAQSG